MAPALLGKIMLARLLELSLRQFERYVARVEASASFALLRQSGRVMAGTWSGAVRVDVGEVNAARAACLGQVCDHAGGLSFVYANTCHVRAYRFDEALLQALPSRHALPKELTATLHRLRLINSRNRLTHALIEALLDIQAPYLISGDPLMRVPLPQAHLSRRLVARGNLPLVADAGRLSRLVRGLSFKMTDGRTLPLNVLFPNERQLHCLRVDALIKGEKTQIREGQLARPLSDDAIAALLESQYGVVLSRRSVAAIRHQLAIPDWHRRGDRKDYLAATEGFSPLLPLTPQALYTGVPPHPGVYEIRSTASREDVGAPGNAAAPDRTQVLYIGSTRDLRKRLSDHLRGNSGNPLLSRHIAEGVARVRFRPVSENWRSVERELYRVFCETFGAPPLANRMRP